MKNIKLTKNKVFQWHHDAGIYAIGYLFAPNGNLYRDADLCAYFNHIENENDFRQKLLSGNGTFSVIIQKEQSLWMAVDRLRYFPLFYRQKKDELLVCDEITDLFEPDESKELDNKGLLEFRALGCVSENRTLLKNAFQIQAGEYVIWNNNHLVRSFYHRYFSEIKNIGFDEAKEQLKNIFQNIAKRMTELVGDRQILLPLSGGFDSRLIAYLLKKEGLKNVLCLTYGKKEGNPEWKRSQAVAEKLGFQWLFVDYTQVNDLDYYKQNRFTDYYGYAAQYVGKFSVSQYFAVNFLTDEMKISTGDSIHLPGHGGDFISGRHLRHDMQNYRKLTAIAKELSISNFHIGDLVQLTRKERKTIKKTILSQLSDISPLFLNFENWELKEREAKCVFPFNKLWEHRGIDSYMPLCDTELMDFFISLPFNYRLNQKLYKAVLTELFAEYDINFPQDVTKPTAGMIRQIKNYIKRKFPFLKNRDIFLFNYFDFKRLAQSILKETEETGEKRKIRSVNGIFSEWYLLQIKNKLQNEKTD